MGKVIKKVFVFQLLLTIFIVFISCDSSLNSDKSNQSGNGIIVFNGVAVYKTLFTADLKNYDKNKHTNIARFHVHFYEIEKEKFPGSPDKIYSIEYTATFDGFKNK